MEKIHHALHDITINKWKKVEGWIAKIYFFDLINYQPVKNIAEEEVSKNVSLLFRMLCHNPESDCESIRFKTCLL